MHGFPTSLVRGFRLTGDLPDDVPAFLRLHHHEDLVGHVPRVADRAGRIADTVGADRQAAVASGWLHDVSLVLPHDAMLQAAEQAGLGVLPEEWQVPALLHGKLSAFLAAQVFGVTDEATLDAMRCHTTLRAGATLMDRVVFVADKLSWDPADAPYHADLTAALSRSLDDGVRFFLAWSWQGRDRMQAIHPWFREACKEYGVGG